MDAKELRGKLDGVIEGRLLPMDLTDEDFRAIRRLVEKVEEWPERAKDILENNEPDPEYHDNMETFLCEIRDFGGE